jgi:hypothetical protein
MASKVSEKSLSPTNQRDNIIRAPQNMTTAEASLRSQPNDADIHPQTDDLITTSATAKAHGGVRNYDVIAVFAWD